MGLRTKNIDSEGEFVRQVRYTAGLWGLSPKAFALLFLVFSIVSCGADSSESDEAAAAPPAESQTEILVQTNLARSKGRMCGDTWYPAAGPVVWNAELEVAAARHSLDMDTNDFFAHEGSDSTTVGDRATDAGYNWQVVGENLSLNAIAYSVAIQGWIDSTSHCEALMRADFEELGVKRVGLYWTMVLGVQL